MSFHERLTLFTLITGMGTASPEETERRRVWAEVTDVGVTTKYTALAAGISAELSAVMHRSEYKGESHAEYRGVIYRISETGRAENDRHVKLILSKG